MINNQSVINNAANTHHEADAVEIVYFTDPLCCWSYAFEPHWQELLQNYKDYLSYRYVMCGLLPDWKTYNDPVNSVSRPAQMGPIWMQAAHLSGLPISSDIWITDPPVSSFPACIGVKCAEQQSKVAGERYLQLAREAVMVSARNISRQEVLLQIAEVVAEQMPAFDTDHFAADLTNGNGIGWFRADWNETRLQNIERFPALIFRRKGKRSVKLSGYQPYAVLHEAFKQVAGDVVTQ